MSAGLTIRYATISLLNAQSVVSPVRLALGRTIALVDGGCNGFPLSLISVFYCLNFKFLITEI
ncbi:MAG: hypothetical protein LBS03_04120, partial [Bacteroidales bacterium]|jgi:hypothetical protein|nr:hypothetical protein [Bacteroidales bacterium]MDR1673419.1 hypothetical protein [Bacteroidales bacterium]